MSGLVGFFLKRSIAVRRLIPDTVGDRILSGAVWAGPCDTRGKFAPPNLNLVPATFVPTGHFVKMRLPVHLAAANIFDRITRFAGEAFGIDGLGGRRHALADRFAAFCAVYRREVPERDVVHRGGEHPVDIIGDLGTPRAQLARIMTLAGLSLFQGRHMKKAPQSIIGFCRKFFL